MNSFPPAKPVELPIACSLDASAGGERLARWRALSANGMPTVHRAPDQLVIRYIHGAGVLDELEQLAAAERECCRFAEWRVTHDAQCVELRIRSSPEGVAAIAALLDAA